MPVSRGLAACSTSWMDAHELGVWIPAGEMVVPIQAEPTGTEWQQAEC